MKQSTKLEFIQLKELLALCDIRLSVAEYHAKKLDSDIQGSVAAAVREVDSALRLLEIIENQEKRETTR